MTAKRTKKILIASSVISLVSGLFLPIHSRAAEPSSLYLSPSSASFRQGSNLIVDLRVNSGAEAVNIVQAYLTYPANKLKVLSLTASSAFSLKIKEDYGDGSMNILRGAVPPAAGDQLVVSITFQTLAVDTQAVVDIDKSKSSVFSSASHQDILKEVRGGTYTILGEPISPGSSAQTPSSSLSDTLKPKISDLRVTNLNSDSPTVSWKTSEPANSQVDYGLNKEYGLSTSDANYGLSHHLILNSPLIRPATLYHFRVKSTDPAGNTGASSDGIFTIKGLSLLITVVNQHGEVVSGAKVSLNDESGLTDKNGQLTLSGFPIGKLIGTVEYKGQQTVVDTEVRPAKSMNSSQPVTFKIKTQPDNAWLITLSVIFLGVLMHLLSKPRLNWLKSKARQLVSRMRLN